MKNAFKNIVAWIYIMFFSVQVFSLASTFFIQNHFTNNNALPFFRFWEALGTPIFENWLPFSVLFITIFVGGILSSQLKSEKDYGRHFLNFTLLCVNLFLCNRLYNIDVFRKKMVLIGDNIWSVLGYVLVVIIVILVGYLLRKSRETRVSNEKTQTTNSHIDNENKILKHNNGFKSSSQDEYLMRRYPISYIWSNFKYYLSFIKKVKHEKKAKYYEEKSKIKTDAKIEIIKNKYEKKVESFDLKSSHKRNKQDNDNKPGKKDKFEKGIEQLRRVSEIFPIGIVFLANIVFLVGVFSLDSFKSEHFYDFFINIKGFIEKGAGFFGKMDNPILNWFMVFGNVLLIVIIFILIDFMLYFVIKVLIYFIFNIKEDKNQVRKFSRQVKTFFFGILDSIMRLLLFLPNFLDVVEDFLLDTDLDELVKERFEEFDKQSDGKSPNTDMITTESSNPTSSVEGERE